MIICSNQLFRHVRRPRKKLALTAVALFFSLAARAAFGTTAQSNAYGASVDINVVPPVGSPVQVLVGPLPISSGMAPVPYDVSDGVASLAASSTTTGPLLQTGVVSVQAASNVPVSAAVTALATINQLDLSALGLVTLSADALQSSAQVSGPCGGPLTPTGTTTLTNPIVGGSLGAGLAADVSPAPNTVLVDTLGVRLVLNEQIVSGDGSSASAITVNAIHLTFTDAEVTGVGVVSGEIIIGHSESELSCPTDPTPTRTQTETTTPTATPTPSDTAASTASTTATQTSTPTNTSTPTATSTASNTAATSPSATRTPTRTYTPTPTRTSTATASPTKKVGAVLSIKKIADQDPVLAGNELTCTITYSNLGKAAANNVVITEAYDSNTSFVAAAPAPDAGTDNRWTFSQLEPGSSNQLLVRVLVNPETPAGTPLRNRVRMDSDSDVSASAAQTSTALAADGSDGASCLYARMSPSELFSGNYTPGTLMLVRFQFSQLCVPATALTLRSTLPEGLSLVSADSGGKLVAGALEWSIPAANAKASQVSFIVRIDSAIAAGSELTTSGIVVDDAHNIISTATTIGVQRPHPSPSFSPLIQVKTLSSIKRSRPLKVLVRYKNMVVGGSVALFLPSNVMLISAKPSPSQIGADGVLRWEGSAASLPNGNLAVQVLPAANLPSGTVFEHIGVVTDLAGSTHSASALTRLQ